MGARDAMLGASWGITPLPLNPTAVAATLSDLTPQRVYFNALNPVFFNSGTTYMPGAGTLPSGLIQSLTVGHETGHLVNLFGPDQSESQNRQNTATVWRGCY